MKKALKKRRQKVADGLPNPVETVRGSLVKRFLACGNSDCRCRQGKGHGPYYYLMTTLGPGKTRMVLIWKDQLQGVRQWVSNFKEYKKRMEKITQINTQWLQMQRQSRGARKKR